MIDKTTLDNMKIELRRGTQALAVLSQLAGGEYGYSLLQRLEEKGVAVEAGTLYPLLRRLESLGFLESTWDTSESRPRKYYQLSEDGKEAFNTLRTEWNRIGEEMNGLFEGVKK